MAGAKLSTGFSSGFNGGASVVGGLYSGYGSASVPAASGIPEGPVTITQQAWGVPPATPAANYGLHAAGISTGALVALAIIWWALPRLGETHMRFSLGSFALGIAAYWAFQHFTGLGNTGKKSSGG